MHYLAVGLRSIISIFDPDLIVLTGGISNAGDALLVPLRAELGPKIRIEISELKSEAGMIGAALLP